MEHQRIPKQGEIYRHFKDRLYQIITVAEHSETGEVMVVYQALYGDFKAYVRPLTMFISEVDKVKYPDVMQQYRFELIRPQSGEVSAEKVDNRINSKEIKGVISVAPEKLNTQQISMTLDEAGNLLLLKFLEAQSYSNKLDILTSNRKHLNDRLINDMAASIDCIVDEGPIDKRIQGVIQCLQAMCRFEDRRQR